MGTTRMQCVAGLLAVAVISAAGASGQTAPSGPSVTPEAGAGAKVIPAPEGLATKAKGAVFRLQGTGRVEGKDRTTSGVGCLIGKDGLGLAPLDAVLGADTVRATFEGQGKPAEVELLAFEASQGLALVRVSLAEVPRRDSLAPLTVAAKEPAVGEAVWGVTAKAGSGLALAGGRVTAAKTLGEFPDKTSAALDFPASTRWLATDPRVTTSAHCGPVLDEEGSLVGWSDGSQKSPEGGSMVLTLGGIRGMIEAPPTGGRAWSDLSAEGVLEAAPASLKPAWMLEKRAAARELSQSLTRLAGLWRCRPCLGKGTVDVVVTDAPAKFTTPNNGPGVGIREARKHTETHTCKECSGRGYARVEDLYREVGKALWSLHGMRPEEPKAEEIRKRADLEFGRMAAWRLQGLAGTVNSRAQAIMGGELKAGETIVLVGLVTAKREAEGKTFYEVALDLDVDLRLDLIVKSKVEVEAPEIFNANVTDAVLVAGLVRKKRMEGSTAVGTIQGGVVFASHADYLTRK